MDERIITTPNGVPGAGASDAPPDFIPVDAILTPLDAGLGMTDMGNAARFAAKYSATVCYVHTWAKHLLWDGKRWKRDTVERVIELAKEVTNEMFASARTSVERKWAAQSGSEGRLSAMVSLANSDQRIAREAADFDATPFVINVDNGHLDLRTGELREHRPSDMMSKITTAAYAPGAQSDLWDGFVERTLPDEEIRDYVQRIVGSSLIGNPVDQRFYLVQGPGATGKSNGAFWRRARRIVFDVCQ